MRENTKNALVHLLMAMIFLLLVSFSMWLIWITYLRDYFHTGMAEDEDNRYYTMTEARTADNPVRFHNMTNESTGTVEVLPLCLMCHSDLPHKYSKEKRAFLNAHGQFIVCEVCHLKLQHLGKVEFHWIDMETRRYADLRPGQSEAGAANKIVFSDYPTAKGMPFGTSQERDYVVRYQNESDILSEAEREKVLEKLHRDIGETPISCPECHTTEKVPFLPFKKLGYMDTRIAELTSIEAAGMVKKYERFYLPDLTRKTGE